MKTSTFRQKKCANIVRGRKYPHAAGSLAAAGTRCWCWVAGCCWRWSLNRWPLLGRWLLLALESEERGVRADRIRGDWQRDGCCWRWSLGMGTPRGRPAERLRESVPSSNFKVQMKMLDWLS
ncbi:Uncharacterized protein Adt_04468 [Abeliophyllum distichum]|uniref:Uncharacterized protein n=1 Tax=Abeliophyllum distichum TaxID=126358 RepID=A0ABD1V1C4_9LAMI